MSAQVHVNQSTSTDNYRNKAQFGALKHKEELRMRPTLLL
jgi:hypothetical protein